MLGPFELATKTAVKEIIENHTTESKFGAFLSDDAKDEIIAEVYELIMMSRKLKTAGDKLLAEGFNTVQTNR